MNTYQISKEELKDKKVLAEGYKIFYQGFKTKHGDYCYADKNGNVEGTFHKVDGDIVECEWGLHFSRNPFDCFSFYECVQWNEFAKVRAYEKVIECSEKTVAQVIEIVEVYTFEEFLEVLKEYNKKEYLSYGVNCSNGVNYSYGVNRSDGVNCSNGVNYSYGVNRSDGVNCSNGVNYSDGVNCSNGVNYSDGVNWSNGVNYSYGVNWSNGVNSSDGVNRSYGVNWSNGVNSSDGVNRSYGIIKSEGITKSIFCYKSSGKLKLFNKKISEERYNEVLEKIKEFDWYPVFNNLFEMRKEKQSWYKANIPGVFEIDNKTAWSKMPKDMKKYIESLPEYKERIFNKIVGDIDD